MYIMRRGPKSRGELGEGQGANGRLWMGGLLSTKFIRPNPRKQLRAGESTSVAFWNVLPRIGSTTVIDSLIHIAGEEADRGTLMTTN